MSTLQQQLQEYLQGFQQRAPAERAAIMENASAELRQSGIEAHALAMHASLPDATLQDVHHQNKSLHELHANRPTVIVFYRGGWCPYCNLTLREWQRLLPELQGLGAQLLAISPQSPDNSLSSAEKNALAFPVLSDSSLAAARAFGLAFDMPAELIDLYQQFGNDLPTLNANGQWALPIPATYVFDAQGQVCYRHVDADYRVRAEPAEILTMIKNMRSESLT